MEKTIIIDGKSVTFRKTGGTMLAYKRETGREFMPDLIDVTEKAGKLAQMRHEIMKKDSGENDNDAILEALENVVFPSYETIYDILHVMARAADKSVPSDVLEWLDGFDDFDAMQVFSEISPMLVSESQVSPKNG